MLSAKDVLGLSPVIPVVTLESAADAVPVARALAKGGVRIIELTLRTPSALESVRLIAREVPGVLVGAGTIVTADQADAAVAAGAGFLVSPGHSPRLLEAMTRLNVPVLPGVATVSEVLTVLEFGLYEMKFFPAEQAGGRAYLAAVGAPLPQVTFCPTGGITAASAPDYLGLANVQCVGGSWLTPADAVREKQWDRIAALAKTAAAL